MKTGFTYLVVTLAAVAPLAAQKAGPDVRAYHDMNVDTLTAVYRLDAGQKKKTIGLLKTWTDTTAPTLSWMAAQKKTGAALNADSSRKIDGATAKFNADFRAILNADQVRRFDAIHKPRVPAHRSGGG
ncbi:MAG: hypothetical protein ACREL5_02230 [Gemmatimonadales bacterium]